MRVVVVESQAFTGSTWFSYVLASHEQAFSLGNPAKAWELFSRRPATTCRIHYGNCPVWAEIARRAPSQSDFLSTIRDVCGVSTLVVYRPRDPLFVEQIGSGLYGEVHRVEIIRDIRERYASWKRRNPDSSVARAVAGPFSASVTARALDAAAATTTLRHELLATDPQCTITAAQRLTGLDIDQTALTYWRHTHHPAHGNGVTHATVRHFQNPTANADEALDPVYLDYLAKVERGEQARFDDDRWQSSVSRYERFVLDVAVGELNQSQGYDRDRFDESERAEFMDRLRAEPDFVERQPTITEGITEGSDQS